LAPTTLSNWVKANKAGKLSEIGKSLRPLTEVELENYRLKKELAENGIHVGICRIKRIKKEQGLYCKQTRKYRSRQEAMQDISEYIEIFYNRQRRQKRPGYLSPCLREKILR